MDTITAHPNTMAVLDAWKRLATGSPGFAGPAADDYPGLVNRLFVISHVDDGDYSFRRVGSALEQLFGRQLAEHNFLSLWGEADRKLVAAALDAARIDGGPAVIRARGQTLDGRKADLEIALAPLANLKGAQMRFLGVCQIVSPDAALGGRPLRRLKTVAVYPPAPEAEPIIRVVRK